MLALRDEHYCFHGRVAVTLNLRCFGVSVIGSSLSRGIRHLAILRQSSITLVGSETNGKGKKSNLVSRISTNSYIGVPSSSSHYEPSFLTTIMNCTLHHRNVLGIEDLFHVYFSCFCVNASVTCSDVRGAYILIAL